MRVRLRPQEGADPFEEIAFYGKSSVSCYHHSRIEAERERPDVLETPCNQDYPDVFKGEDAVEFLDLLLAPAEDLIDHHDGVLAVKGRGIHREYFDLVGDDIHVPLEGHDKTDIVDISLGSPFPFIIHGIPNVVDIVSALKRGEGIGYLACALLAAYDDILVRGDRRVNVANNLRFQLLGSQR